MIQNLVLRLLNENLVVFLCLYFSFFIFAVYICAIADVNESKCARFINIDIPVYLEERFLGEAGREKIHRLNQYLSYERNPILQIVYCAVIFGGWSVMFFYGYPLIPNVHVGAYHKINGYFVFAACISSWVAVVRRDPGHVTLRTMSRYDNYSYDGWMFENRKCPTAGIRKIARSKYDRMSSRHVPRYDHYCGWVNQTIGEENYRLFLLFLLIHAGMLWYGTIVTTFIFYSESERLGLNTATFYDSKGNLLKTSRKVGIQYMMQRYTALVSLWVVMFVLALVLTGFVLFHTYLIYNGMTTNEFYKWKAVRKWHAQASTKYALYVGKRAKENATTSNQSSKGSGVSQGYLVPEDVDIGCVGPTLSSKSIPVDESKIDVPKDPGVLPVDFPYNLGSFRKNLHEVLFPRCFRERDRDAQETSAFRKHD